MAIFLLKTSVPLHPKQVEFIDKEEQIVSVFLVFLRFHDFVTPSWILDYSFRTEDRAVTCNNNLKLFIVLYH